jgi:hypothetical protein
MVADQPNEQTRAAEIDRIDAFLLNFDDMAATMEDIIKIKYDTFYEPEAPAPAGASEEAKEAQ